MTKMTKMTTEDDGGGKNQEPARSRYQLVFSPQPHYDNTNGSLYAVAERLGLNAYEFDILKRVCRCRKKGQFKEDLQKIKDTVDLYLAEHDTDG